MTDTNPASFDDLQPIDGYPSLRESARRIEEWCDQPTSFLVIHGDIGTGKTHCAEAAGHKLSVQGKEVFFTTTVNLLDELRLVLSLSRTFGREVDYTLVEKVRSVDVLILDGLGFQRETDFVHEQLGDIFGYRLRRRLTTIVTTTLSPDAIWEWDPMIASRMFRSEESVQVPMHGPDYRRFPGNAA